MWSLAEQDLLRDYPVPSTRHWPGFEPRASCAKDFLDDAPDSRPCAKVAGLARSLSTSATTTCPMPLCSSVCPPSLSHTTQFQALFAKPDVRSPHTQTSTTDLSYPPAHLQQYYSSLPAVDTLLNSRAAYIDAEYGLRDGLYLNVHITRGCQQRIH